MTVMFQPVIVLRVIANNQAYEIKDLHVDFDVKLDQTSKPNIAKFTIYKLSPSTRNLFSESYQAIEFLAGYAGNPVLIFKGVIKSVSHEQKDIDWMTEITAADGLKEYTRFKFSKTYTKGTKYLQILEDVSAALGLPLEIDRRNVSGQALTSVSYSDSVATVLNLITRDLDLQWSIQNGVLEITDLWDPLPARVSAVLINKQTGMIEAPKRTLRTLRSSKKETDSIVGIKLRSLLNVGLRPSRLIELESDTEAVNGVYLVRTSSFFGDNYGGPFATEIEGDLIG